MSWALGLDRGLARAPFPPASRRAPRRLPASPDARRPPLGPCRLCGRRLAGGGRAFALLGFDGKKAAGPPKPAKEFTKKDIKRIKQEGPHIDDLVVTAKQKWRRKGETAVREDVLHAWVPPSVLGDGVRVAEPRWGALPRINYLQLLTGLQRRNWTSKFYDPEAVPWRLDFFKDNGRTWGLSWNGYRVLVTSADGEAMWAALPRPGLPTFTGDHLAGGTRGGQWRAKRVPKTPEDLGDCGYNQVFEELFQAYQQALPPEAARQWRAEAWVDQGSTPYDCPADARLAVAFHALPAEPNVPVWLGENAPRVGMLLGSLSFIFVCLWIAIFKPRKAMPSDAYMAIEFAQSKGQARQEGRTGVKFADVAGMGKTLQDLQDIVEFLKNPARSLALGTKPPKGVLLEGEPGTGKTLVAKAVAGEAGVPFYQMSGSEFVEAIVGVGAARVRDLFKRARVQEGPCIIFVDEIDAVGARRADAGEQTNEEREQTLNQLLTEMDGFTPDSGVVFIAATNRSDLLDPALMRAGRFDKKFLISRPDTEGRHDVLQVHTRSRPMADDVDLMQIARDLPGLSGAELANVVNEGALESARRGGDHITSLDLYNGIDRILQGVRRPGLPRRMQMRARLAVHEAGKALVAVALRRQHLAEGRRPHLEAVERVTILPRGREWTRTIFLRGEDEDYTMATRGRLLQRLRVVVAGRAAEEVALPEGPTTYGRQALADAQTLAQKVVAAYGLSAAGVTMYATPALASDGERSNYEVSVDKIDEDAVSRGLDGGMYQAGDRTIGRIKRTAQDLVRDAYADDVALLRRHRAALEAATAQLLERETLSGGELDAILDAHPPVEADAVLPALPRVQDAFPVAESGKPFAYSRA